ncbi:hypothetical protein CKM354_000730600 [Cercospora kikuchii]|uniref:Tautomerase cis-CaaD-like domain-containing protein n=1 Tax=Cercospora kikuchii TaxID=84275 RepID=A0A9P3CIZ2_9PEZI|nr:uncharacterized protein CKM354_000730600 [Cercospora kikuchii]GIZ44097.1 hypothetical protein CKM354_000730600 [Cercospora kikuchii]
MPFYEVRHVDPLSQAQQDSLAEALTTIHSTKFTTPRLFVNVGFVDQSKVNTYVAGKPRKGNSIAANVRVGPSRTQKDWDQLCEEVVAAWQKIVPDAELRGVFILGSMTAGWEAGFTMPSAGQDVQWLKDNWQAFEEKAKAGDEDFADMLIDIKQRGLQQQANGK